MSCGDAMRSHIAPLPSDCWNSCFGKWVVGIVAPQLNELANDTLAVVVVTRTDAFRRRQRMMDQLSSLGKAWPRPTFVGCDFEHLPAGCPGSCFDNRSVAAREPATVALALAHVAISTVLRTFRYLRTALVLEDDIIAPPNALHSLLQRVMHALKREPVWDFVALGCSSHGERNKFAIRPGMQTCSRMYLISRTGMDKMANGLPLADPIDLAMPRIFGLANRNVYHTGWWQMRHGSCVHRLNRGRDF